MNLTKTQNPQTEENMEVAVRLTVYDMVDIRRKSLNAIEEMKAADKKVDDLLKPVNGYNFYRLDRNEKSLTDEKAIDLRLWQYLVKLYNLERYMLCTEYDKMMNQLNSCDFPEFTPDNVESWLLSLKSLIYENIQKLIEDVFNRITQSTYRTGGSWNSSVKKKRNNNGIDKFFIISTQDCYAINWYSGKPTITDDLEKACYILDGKDLPEMTIKNNMRKGKIWESENEYFWIRICKNGNTQYKIKDAIRNKLNLYGSRKGIIGENIKIKVFEKE